MSFSFASLALIDQGNVHVCALFGSLCCQQLEVLLVNFGLVLNEMFFLCQVFAETSEQFLPVNV